MCLTCGCMKPHDDHGNKDYLVIEQLERSAKLDKKSLNDALKTLTETVRVAKDETEHQQR